MSEGKGEDKLFSHKISKEEKIVKFFKTDNKNKSEGYKAGDVVELTVSPSGKQSLNKEGIKKHNKRFKKFKEAVKRETKEFVKYAVIPPVVTMGVLFSGGAISEKIARMAKAENPKEIGGMGMMGTAVAAFPIMNAIAKRRKKQSGR